MFQSASLTGSTNLTAFSIQYVLNVVTTWGGRPVLLIGSIFMAVWMFAIGGLLGTYCQPDFDAGNATTTWAIKNNQSASRAVIACSYLFVCSFAISWEPVSWTYPAEIYPLRIRSKAVSFHCLPLGLHLCSCIHCPPTVGEQSVQMYFIFGAFYVAMTIYVFFMFPETKGRTLEEMDDLFNSDVPRLEDTGVAPFQVRGRC
ncbi:hypothetical protein BGZ83_005701 [Gryganskiella cystojenkinii]|nr:hypothetical protein BGZ83_005701 [Gryganskiella cystojenkinii]